MCVIKIHDYKNFDFKVLIKNTLKSKGNIPEITDSSLLTKSKKIQL